MTTCQTDVVLFDLGAVIVDIAVPNLYQAFAHLLARYKVSKSIESLTLEIKQSDIWVQHEIGTLSDNAFFENIRQRIHPECTMAEIQAAWNSIILSVPKAKLTLLSELKKHKRLLLLSNTNKAHIDYIQQLIAQMQMPPLQHYFHSVYYSFEMGLRKPDAAIFQVVLKHERLKPNDVFFIDDSAENIEAAAKLGFGTALHPPSAPIDVYFPTIISHS